MSTIVSLRVHSTLDMLPCCGTLPSSPSISKFITDHPALSILETKCTTMSDLRQLHSHLIATGLASDHISISRVLAFCASSPHGDLNYALRLFSHHANPNAFMYNTLIRGFSHSSTPYIAISIFLQMLNSTSIHPQRLTFPSVFVACSQLGLLRCGVQLHAMVLKLGYAPDPFIRNSMLSMYLNCGRLLESWQLFDECCSSDVVSWNSMIIGLAKNGHVDEARCLFDEMPERNVVSWSAMISGCVRNGRNEEAFQLFSRMQQYGVKPNANVLASLLGASACLGALEQGELIHKYIERNRFEPNPILVTAIIDMYCKCGSVKKALQLFESSSTKGHLSAWNSMILGLGMHGHFEQAAQLFSRLRSSNLRPDNVTFLNILAACNHAGNVDKAWHYLSLMINEYDIELGVEHYGCMVDMLCRAGLIEEAEELIERMPMEPDSAILGSLLSASRLGLNIDTLRRIERKTLHLDHLDRGAYIVLSNAYAVAGDVSNAIKRREMIKDSRMKKEPGCSMIEIDGVPYEFVAGGVLHPKAKEIYQILDGLHFELRGQVPKNFSTIDIQEDFS